MAEEIDRHDRLVIGIAEQSFRFPDRDHTDWATYTNTSSRRTMGVETENENEPVYPDIVVLQNRRVVILVEVETETGVNQDEALQWLRYSSLCETFYLYVPEDYEDVTEELLRENEIRINLRTYGFEDSNLVITDR
jgi:hypothetical protein